MKKLLFLIFIIVISSCKKEEIKIPQIHKSNLLESLNKVAKKDSVDYSKKVKKRKKLKNNSYLWTLNM